eukprot:m.281435 g.281435  ORF g.281435 m.281435 type:complete len:161 (+) comp19839_c0_seq6:364-846(+)
MFCSNDTDLPFVWLLPHSPSCHTTANLYCGFLGDDHCTITGNVVTQIRLPKNWTSASDCIPGDNNPNNCRSKPNQPNNNAMGVLLEDNETIVQMQPAYRCSYGGPLLARFGNTTDGCPQQFPNVTSVFGDGSLGSHGGSGAYRFCTIDVCAPFSTRAIRL